MYVSVLFKLKYSLQLLRRFNFIRYKKQHVRLLSLCCFCILLLNWNIRLPSLCGFHISHRKIRSNTRINTLFQLTSTRLRYHITFTIAVVIQATEKQFPWHKWLKNEISDYAHYAVLLHYYQNEISDYANYPVLFSLLLKWNLWLRSLRCFTSVLLKGNLWLQSLRCFTSILLKWNIRLHSLRYFYFHYY